MLSVDIPQLSSAPTLVPNASSIMVSWSPTNLIPLSYRISYSCQLMCGSSVTNQTVTVDGSVTTHTVSATPGSSCVIGITAVFCSNNSNTITSSTNTTSTGTTCSVLHVQYMIKICLLSSPYWYSWKTH